MTDPVEKDPEDLKAKFAVLLIQQEECEADIRRILTNAKKSSKERRTAAQFTKLSNEVEFFWSGYSDRDLLLRQYESYAGSDYALRGTFKAVEVHKCETLQFLSKPVEASSSIRPSSIDSTMRSFYYTTLLNMLEKYEGRADFNGLDAEFILDRMERYFQSFVVYHDKVRLADPSTQAQLSTDHDLITARFQLFIVSVEQQPSIADASGSIVHDNQTPAAAPDTISRSPHCDFRLPRIELPKFTGDLNKWHDFHVKFVSLIHDNKLLNNVQRMTYLQSCLVGEALDAVKNLTFSEYDKAWELILRRFNNNKVLIFHELKKLMGIFSATERAYRKVEFPICVLDLPTTPISNF